MKVSYHEDTDSAYITFHEGLVADDTREIAPNINVDIAADGKLIGIEIVANAKSHLELGRFTLNGVKSFEVVNA